MNKETGGPAFPQKTDLTLSYSGMTLRDYFAAHSIQTAMQMVKQDFNKDGEIFHWNQSEREIVAGHAYNLADAMLKAREA